jgi:hypothetical protein
MYPVAKQLRPNQEPLQMREYTDSAEFDEFRAAREQFDQLVGELKGENAKALELGEAEALVEREGTELLRRLLQGHLDRRSRGERRERSVVGADGQERTHRRAGQTRRLMSVFGEVTLNRHGYSRPGLVSHFPLDEALNLSEDKYSPGLRRRVAQEAAKGSFDEAVESIVCNTGGKVPKRQAQMLTREVSQDFEAYYEAKAVESSEGLLVMSADGKGIVVRPDDLRPATRKAAERSQHKLKTRLSRGEKRNRKRMSTVAAVYDIEPNRRSAQAILGLDDEAALKRPRPANKRVWASLRQEPQEVIEQVFREALRRDPERKRTWLMLVDGHEAQLRTVYEAINRHQAKVVVIQDFVHVLEYLWKAAYCFHGEGTEQAERWVMQRALAVLEGKASDVAAGMRRSATRKDLSQQARVPVDKCADYLLKNKDRLDYATALENGWPIATGVIEGACRHLVKDRMEITGARWSLDGAEAVLQLRSLHASGDLADYMAFHRRQERERNYGSCAASSAEAA